MLVIWWILTCFTKDKAIGCESFVCYWVKLSLVLWFCHFAHLLRSVSVGTHEMSLIKNMGFRVFYSGHPTNPWVTATYCRQVCFDVFWAVASLFSCGLCLGFNDKRREWWALLFAWRLIPWIRMFDNEMGGKLVWTNLVYCHSSATVRTCWNMWAWLFDSLLICVSVFN